MSPPGGSRNAHNLVDQSSSFFEFPSHFPKLSRWVEASYGTQAKLLWGNNIILSCIGFQQGDAMAGLGQALTMYPVIQTIQEIASFGANAWLQDNGTIISSQGSHLTTLAILE